MHRLTLTLGSLLALACTGSSGAVGVDPGAAASCESAAECGPTAPLCGPEGTCVQCADELDCDAGRCVGGACVECAADADCTGDAPFCLGRRCVACRGPVDCEPEEPVCAPDGDCLPPCPLTGCEPEKRCHPTLGACVDCAEDADCVGSDPRCDPVELECVECLSGADCGGANPICVDGECEACVTDADCPSGQRCNASLECE